MNHTIQCTCGAVKGAVQVPKLLNRCVCYCKDCQSFAHFLNRAPDILDAQGGTDIIQVQPQYISFSQGMDKLACMRLSEKGVMRWYTSCCNTPIGNGLADFKISFIGLIHTCLENDSNSLDKSFGPVLAHVNTESAKGKNVKVFGLAGTILRVARIIISSRISGSFKTTPFFSAETGAPIAAPLILSREERQALRNRL